MSLAYYARNAANGERARRRMKREGENMSGDKLWSADEDEVVRSLYPDYGAMAKALPHRSYGACRGRSRTLKVATERHSWTGAEISRLRRLFPTATPEELLEAFPGMTLMAIKGAAKRHRIFRKRRPFKPIGNPPVDEMLEKLFRANFSFIELDKECRTKRYFAHGNWRYRKLNYNRLVKAIELLDGELAVRWRDE